MSMRKGFLQQYGAYAALLLMCLVLGVVAAAAADALTGDDESTDDLQYALGAAALMLAIGVTMKQFAPATGIVAHKEDGMLENSDSHNHNDSHSESDSKAYAHLSALVSAMDTGILLMSPDERVAYCNSSFLRIWNVPAERVVVGLSLEEAVALTGGALARPGEQQRFLLRASQGDNAGVKLDLPLTDGRLLTQYSQPVLDAKGATLGRMWVYEDVTVERRNARQLALLAERDALTGLYNRHRFNEEIVRMSAEAQRGGSRLALIFFDLDGFKYINDTYGHRAGDATLIRIAKAVSGQARRNEMFARLGGDEFAILVPDVPDDILKLMAARITRTISQARVDFEGESMQVTCSCGIAVYPDNAATPDALLACADAAMYEAKEAGKNGWRLSSTPSDAKQSAPSSLLSPAARVRHIMDNRLLAPHFQGIYTTREGTFSHYETLLRIRNADNPGEFLLPGEFIALAEKSESMNEVDRWMLGHAIETLALHPAIPAMSVNISGRSLYDDTLPAFIESEFKRRGVAAKRLVVELTETAVVSDLHDARRFMQALQTIGCGVSLDDFGTGFSSFAYLKHLNVDSIKIDGLFIRDLPRDRENQLFVQAIVTVAHGLHKTTIAECVEDEATLKILASLGVDYVQGFHLDVPHTTLQ